jgi:hypothetical protein
MVTVIKNTEQEREQARRQVIEYYLAQGLKTPEDLHRFITTLSRQPMPWKHICPNHRTPFDYLANAFFSDYDHPLTGKPMGMVNQLVIASRGGSKTSTTGKLNALELIFKPGIEISSVGAIQTQAQACYNYTRNWIYDPLIEDRVYDSTLQQTMMTNSALYRQLIGTMTGVNSPHPQKLRADEVELLRSDAVLQEMYLVPMSSEKYRGSMDIISTRKFPHGIMQYLVEHAEELFFNLITWCYKEISEPCPESRRGKGRKWIELLHPDTGEPCKYKMYEGCVHCKLSFSCRGDLARSQGYYKIDDLLKELGRTTKRTWLAQKECRRPGFEGLIYPDYVDEIGNPISIVIPNCGIPDGWYVAEGYDFGSDDPTAIGWWAIRPDTKKVIKIVEYYARNTTVNHHVQRILAIRDEFNMNNHRMFRWGDPQGRNMRIEFANRGIDIKKAYNAVDVGLDMMASLMEQRDEEGHPQLQICERCVETRKEYVIYHFKPGTDKPEKKNDHTCDSDRYSVVSTIAMLRKYNLRETREGTLRPEVTDRPTVDARP